MSNAYAYAIALSLMGGIIGVFLKIIYDSNKMQKKLIDLEYKEEKNEISKLHQNDSADSIIARFKRKFGWK